VMDGEQPRTLDLRGEELPGISENDPSPEAVSASGSTRETEGT
jgi:hypothetical protein